MQSLSNTSYIFLEFFHIDYLHMTRYTKNQTLNHFSSQRSLKKNIQKFKYLNIISCNIFPSRVPTGTKVHIEREIKVKGKENLNSVTPVICRRRESLKVCDFVNLKS